MSYYDREDLNSSPEKAPSYKSNQYQEQRRELSAKNHVQQQLNLYNQNESDSSTNLYPPNNQSYNNSQDYLDSNNHSTHYNNRNYENIRGGGGDNGNYDRNDSDNYDNTRNYTGEKNYSNGSNQTGTGSKTSHKKRWILIIIVILICAGAGAGIAVWRIHATQGNNLSSSSSGKGTSLRAIPGTAGAVMSNPSDPSDFQKDPRLHKSFYGFAYTPFLAQEPQCGATLANITEDIQIISQLTTRIRTYGSGCNQSSLIMQAIKDTKVNMTVWLGVYIGTNETVNDEQMDETIKVIKTYGTKNIGGVSVGNEYILNAANPITGTAYIVAKMASFRAKLAAASPPIVGIPVGTADAGSEVTTALSIGSDYVMANIHPFFGGLPIAQAASWTWEFFQGNDLYYTEQAPNKPIAYIAETGWPTTSLSPANCTLGGSVCGVAQSSEYLATYPCTANTNGTRYFYFEAFDEPWKDVFGGVEPFWGIFDENKVLKTGIKLPTCISP